MPTINRLRRLYRRWIVVGDFDREDDAIPTTVYAVVKIRHLSPFFLQAFLQAAAFLKANCCAERFYRAGQLTIVNWQAQYNVLIYQYIVMVLEM